MKSSDPAPQALVLLAHPDGRSYCAAICKRAAAALRFSGYSVQMQDLYRSGFDPVLSYEEFQRGFSLEPVVQQAVRELRSAQRVVVVHPDWWGGPPAILKGWVERVFRLGVAYDYRGPEPGPKVRTGLLHDKEFLVINTRDSSSAEDHAALRRYWSSTVLGFCGIQSSDVRVFGPLHGSRPGTRKAWLYQVEELCTDEGSTGSTTRKG